MAMKPVLVGSLQVGLETIVVCSVVAMIENQKRVKSESSEETP